MRARMVAALAVLLLVGSLIGSLHASAEDAKGCEGLAPYRAKMTIAGNTYARKLADIGYTEDREILSYSSQEWVAIADATLEAQTRYKKITPPPFAQAYHDNLIAKLGLIEQLGRAIADNGPFAALVFTEPIDEIDSEAQIAIDAALAACPDFAKLLPDEVATPQASPAP